MDTEPLVFVGVDWASTEHQVCLTGTGEPIQRALAHDASGFGGMVDWLCDQTEKPGQIAAGIETPHGPIVDVLMDRGVAVFALGQQTLASIQTGALHPHLNCGDVKDIRVPLPPLSEQKKIAEKIEIDCENFAQLEAEATRAIVLLRERRAALISAAVTGKIDVRNAVTVAEAA